MTNYRPSRLKRFEEKRALRSTALYIALTVGVVVLLFTLGIPLVSRLAILVGNVTRTDLEYGQDSPPPPPPRINEPKEATNEEKLKITGYTNAGNTVAIYFNDEKTEVLATASGEFTAMFDLSIGPNTVYAEVVDSRGQKSMPSEKFTVTLDKEPPKLEIISPENGKSFFGATQKQTQIDGQSEPNTHITINDRVVIVKNDGKFNFPVSLEPGENTFKIVATDEAGNKTELEFKLSYSS